MSRTDGEPTEAAPLLDRVMGFVARRPGVAYSSTCGAFLALFVLWVVLIFALGSDFLPFEADVPLYLRGNVARERLDAVYQGKEQSTVALNMPDIQLRRVSDRDVDNEELTYELLWTAASGNMFAVRHLARMVEVERRIFASEGFQAACLLTWPAEALEVQAQALLNASLYGTVAAMNRGDGPYAGACRYPDSMAWGCARPDGERGCEAAGAFPPGVLDCRRAAGCTAPEHFEPLNMTFVRLKVAQYANTNPFDVGAPAAARLAYTYVDSAFGAGNDQGRALRTQFRMGVPFGDARNLQDDLAGQTEELKKHIWKHFSDIASGESTAELDVQWNGYGMSGQLIEEQLPKDGAFALGSMLFVWVYAMFTLQSVFAGSMGVGQILMGFAPAYLVYYAVFNQRYFGVFNVLSVFIILGIGADNVFVMMDAWTQSKGDTATRLAGTWRRSAGALAVTSVTTMASFLSNATSSFPAIQTFGIFAALLVLVNYCAVVTFYISVVSFNERYFAAKAFCCGVWGRVVGVLVQPNEDDEKAKAQVAEKGHPETSHSGTRYHNDVEMMEAGAATAPRASDRTTDAYTGPARVGVCSKWAPPPTPESALEGLGRVERWFHESFAGFVIRWRVLIVLVFHVAVALFVWQAAKLQPDPNPPEFFPDDVTYQSYYPKLASYFQRGGSVYALKQQLVWGFDAAEPIDRAGTRASSIDDRGAPVYDEKFSLAKSAECVIQICNAAEEPNEALGLGGAPEYPVTCAMRHFKAWFVSGGSPGVNASVAAGEWKELTRLDGGEEEEEVFLLHFGTFLLSDPKFLDLYKPLSFGDYVSEMLFSEAAVDRYWMDTPRPANATGQQKVKPRFVMATLKLTAERTIDFDVGLDMFEAWEAWWAEQYTQGACAAGKEYASGFHNTRGEYLGWDYFFVQEKLVGEAMFGIAISLILALVVLTLATHNFMTGFFAVLIITEIVVSVVAFAVMVGWKLGILESICFVMVPGMSVDYVAHLAEAYNQSPFSNRHERVRDMLTKVGVSILSGAFSTLGATMFLFFPLIVFFVKFGTFIFVTILYSLLFSLLNFAALMALVGPQERDADFWHLIKTRCIKGEEVAPSTTSAQEQRADKA